MFKLEENLIRRYCTKIVYDKGLDYFYRNRVRNLKSEETKMSNNSKTIKMEALFSGIGKEYMCYTEFNELSGIKNSKCTCGTYHYYNYGICEHIAAMLIKYVRDSKEIKIPYEHSEELLKRLKSLIKEDNIIKENVRLKYKYYFSDFSNYYRQSQESHLEFKIGTDRLYVVKNIGELIEANYYRNSEIKYGAGFTFESDYMEFEGTDKQLMDLIKELYDIDKKFKEANSSNYYYGSQFSMIKGKKATLPEGFINKFFNVVIGTTIDANILGEDYEDIKVLEQNLPLSFALEYDENNFGDTIIILKNGEDVLPIPLTADGEFLFYKNAIYKPSKEQIDLYSEFYNQFIKNPEHSIVFDKDQSEGIASFVIPALNSISSELKLDTKLEENFYKEPLNITVYLDKAEEAVTAKIKFTYGDMEIDPLDSNRPINNNKVLIRDIKGEEKLLSILSKYEFHKSSDKYVLDDDDMIIDFISTGADEIQDIADIYYSESFKGINIFNSSHVRSSVRLNENDFLEFSFKLDGVEDAELSNIFRALKEKKKYYKLRKGGFVDLDSKQMQDVGNLIEYLDLKDSDLKKEKILLSKYNAMYIDQSIKDNDMNFIEKNKRFKELVNNIREPQDSDFILPDGYDNVLRNYQKVGFKWLKTLSLYGFGGILADEMGLGKTLETISFIEAEMLNEGDKKLPALVICPSSLVFNWENEIKKFSKGLKTLTVVGTKQERTELIKNILDYDVAITSYPLMRRDIEEYGQVSFSYCFLDEAQQIKNPDSVNAKSVKEIKAKGYFALTGTPIENSLTELWSIFDFIMPGYLKSHTRFKRRYEVPIVKSNDQNALKELNKHIKPFILRRLKKDVIKELPPKIEHVLVAEMTDEQKKVYVSYLNAAKGEIQNEIKNNGINKSKLKILSVLTRLRQICCEPSVFIENYTGESGKMLLLDDILEQSIGEGHRILLFSQFTSVLKEIQKRLQRKDISYMYLDGNTKVQERGLMVKEFNEGKGDVFLISLKAGGTGLNLVGADQVIHFDPWWNPAVENQASDRAHRIGQKKTVEVLKLIAKGTIEEKIALLQDKKKEMINNVIDNGEESGEVLLSGLNEEEIKELLEFGER